MIIILFIIFLLLVFTEKSSTSGKIIRGILKFIGIIILMGFAFCTLVLLGSF
ncbi:MAG: hypothetical protein U0518_00080 [Candidatus Gracilibacteria bacterium]